MFFSFNFFVFLSFSSFFFFFSLKAVFCCAPQKISEEEDLYTEADIVDIDLICSHSDCDESFFTDIATSLNAIGNPLTGCASGLGVNFIFFIFFFFFGVVVVDILCKSQEPEYELDVLIEKAMAEFIRPCLVRAGYGGLLHFFFFFIV